MKIVALVTDSTADLSPELARQNQITVVPLTLHMGGEEYLDGIDIQPEEFYRRLSVDGSVATTSQPSPGRFAEVYRRLLQDHQQILSLHLSADLSGTAEAARQAAELVAPERITVIDTRLVTMALG
ncbi:MAG: DegV family protein, partial [Candidatus Dormibacteraceae bacterium]